MTKKKVVEPEIIIPPVRSHKKKVEVIPEPVVIYKEEVKPVITRIRIFNKKRRVKI